MSENENIKNILRPIVKYVKEELDKTEERLQDSFSKGEVGPRGERGQQGDQGPQGVPGDSGGPKGALGEKGNSGIQGERGERGFIGEQGNIGEQGDQGLRGFTGDPGEFGKDGGKGDKGDRGEIGPRGLLGEQGIQGDLGVRGARGQRGQKGDLGEQGLPGIIGSKGDSGDKGVQGEIGPKGDLGEQGIPGEAGSIKRVEKEFDKFKDDVIEQIQQSRAKSSGGTVISGGGAVKLMNQRDVKTGTPADGQILKYDSSEGKFVLSAASAGTDFTSDIADLVTANTIQNVELGNLGAQTATFNSTSTVNLWGKSQGTTPESITITGSSHTIDLRDSNLFYVTLQNTVEVTLSNIADVVGCAFTFIVTQDATGSRAWTWHSSTTPKYPGGFVTALSTAALSSDIISLVVANSTFVYATTGHNYK